MLLHPAARSLTPLAPNGSLMLGLEHPHASVPLHRPDIRCAFPCRFVYLDPKGNLMVGMYRNGEDAAFIFTMQVRC